MYSYEDRLQAVRLYIKLGERAGLTIRQLGYPTKNSLKSWHLEYTQRLDSVGYARQPRYTQAQKIQAIEHAYRVELGKTTLNRLSDQGLRRFVDAHPELIRRGADGILDYLGVSSFPGRFSQQRRHLSGGGARALRARRHAGR